MHAIIHSFFLSFIHSFIQSFFLSFIHSFIHPSIHLFIHLFIHSFVHSFIHSFVHSFIHSFIHSVVLRRVHMLFQIDFSTECILVVTLSISSILSFLLGHPVAVYIFFVVFVSCILPSNFPSITSFRKQHLPKM